MSLRTIRRMAWGGVFIVCLALGAVAGIATFRSSPSTPGLVLAVDQGINIGGEFNLVDQNGRHRTWSEFRGKPAALFFGFTNCPDICPTTLGELSLMLTDLGEQADDLSVILISGDPARDTPEVLETYMQSFDPRIVALTGDEEAIAETFSAFNAFRKIIPLEGGAYTVDHSAGVYLFDRDGRFTGTLDSHESKEVQREKLDRLLNA